MDDRPYNLPMRAAPLLLLLSLAACPVLAQNPPAEDTAPRSTPADRTNQRVERIHVEDKGSRVDEVRIGGKTQSITVTPLVSDLPAYEVQPSHDVQDRNRSSSGTTGPRVWNMMKF